MWTKTATQQKSFQKVTSIFFSINPNSMRNKERETSKCIFSWSKLWKLKMYKSKLQELCHRKRWVLPKYSAMKEGPDHLPFFKASVSVNGVTFHSPGRCFSSKDAYNKAAMAAFNHFSSGEPSPPADSSRPTAEPDAKEQGIEVAKRQDLPIPSDSSVTANNDLTGMYKNQLQNFAQRKKLGSPIFASKREGSPHASHFKATVIVDGQSFDSPTFFNTLREAEQAAAKIALMSLSIDSFQKGDSGIYKNLLQELTQREGNCIPIYRTTKSGSPHMPTFFSIVEVEGKEFCGKEGRSKKQAEQDAAKVAYIALKEGGFSSIAAFSSSDFIENKAVESFHTLGIVKSKQHSKHESPFLSSNDEDKDELEELDHIPADVKVSNQTPNLSFLRPPDKDMMSNKNSTSSEPKADSSTSKLDLSALSISESSNARKAPETSGYYLLCNRFKVYTFFPEIAFPKGITVLPISDNKWVAVSLEFPNEKAP